MENNLLVFYKNLGFELVSIVSKEFNGIPKDIIEDYQYSVVVLGSGFDVRFTQWSGKPFYVIAFHADKYVFEIDLSRIIVENNTYTWYLNIPTHQKNIDFLNKKIGLPTEIPTWYRDKVINIKKSISGGTRVRKDGYLICEQVSYSELKSKFLDVFTDALRAHQLTQSNFTESDEVFNDYESAIEGQSQDYITTKKSRNQKIVQARKEKDEYKCQACGFKLKINGIYIIDCHHINPLSESGTIITSIEQLVCLCPSCHRIAHTRKLPLSVAEIKAARNISG